MCHTDRQSGGYDISGGADIKGSGSDRGGGYEKQYPAFESF